MKAFPTPTFSINDEARVTAVGGEGGMDLRDYFAAKAIEGFCVASTQLNYDITASDAYSLADAMLKEREKKYD